MTRLKTTGSNASKEVMEFIVGIFGDIAGDAEARPLFCGFSDDPGSNKGWSPRAIKNGKLPTSITDTNNCYFSVATFRPDGEGKYRAKKQQVAANYAILLDDIGTKAKRKLPITPSWKIKTSPGNYQVGFLLKTPCADPVKYQAVVNALGKAGWGDRGASGVARWARLPYGVNTKEKYLDAGKAPKVELVHFHPERRYSLKRIIKAFELDTTGVTFKVTSSGGKGGDAVLLALKVARLWKGNSEPGMHDITCPWVKFHTDQKDHGTAYYEPSPSNKRLGGFICQHGHCSGRGIADLRGFLDIPGERPRKESVLDTALGFIENAIPVFLDENGEPFGLVNKHCLPLKGREIKSQILQKTREATGKTLKQGDVNEVLATLESKAIIEDERRELHNRIALFNGNIWYDLGDGMSVKVMPSAWEIVEAPPLFRRYGHQQVQVRPKTGGDPMKLFRFLNIKKAHRLETMVLLISYLIPDIAHPIFHPHGAQGSGKSTLCKMIKKLLDPSSLGVLLVPRDRQELIRLISRHHIPIFDNMSKLDSDMSDVLCMACTGGGVVRRVLYTDDEDNIVSLRRCCGLNGINLLISKPDLLDRTMLLRLERIPPEKRRVEAKMWQEFEKAMPEILGGMFDVLARAFDIHPQVDLDQLPRLADFATWGYAIGEALEEGKGKEFLVAYRANVRRQNEEVIKNNSLCLAVKILMRSERQWEGTVKMAFVELSKIAVPIKSDPTFPADAKNLRRHLERIQTTLAESENITYRVSDKAKKDGYHITFTKGAKV